jgi:hypothetical protein
MDFDRLADELSKPANESIRWLLGDALLNGGDNILTDALLRGGIYPVPHWNALIRQFRVLLKEPELAVAKVRAEVKLPAKLDRVERDGRLRDVYAECASVIWLHHHRGHFSFEALPSAVAARPDFRARHGSQTIGIEVKNLREPGDVIDVVAQRRWHELKRRDPSKYSFGIQLFHLHHSWISDNARSRLRTILDQLPDRREEVIEETLDGDITVRIEKSTAPVSERGPEFDCSRLMQTALYSGDDAGLVIRSAILESDLLHDQNDFQGFFLKVLRVVAEATPKFFARSAESFDNNLVAMRWETPSPIIDPTYVERSKTLVETLFKNIGLSLHLEIFYGNPPLNKE